ncbi:MAG: toll/interleukin receptor protein [Alphaproteobacteria bacterium]|nr:toll/interleukin receptor protein [Alphaproteobacteria bacterium]
MRCSAAGCIRLEGYRLPRRLAGSDGERGLVPARLTPIFRDREELPAAGDLSERVPAALAVSGSLIVVCSPNAAASPWVAKEIETFRQLHSDRPIFAAIVAGEPGQCFPPALRHGHGGEIEPLAADFRKDSDGRRLGLLKLVAGIAGIGLDQLVQRDAQRRIRRVTAVTLAAIIGMLVAATMAIVAINARAEAQRQRREAEGLVEFMLTDLRDRLKGVGRLDVLTAVNQRALGYYQKQDIRRLTPDSLERRARILHAMGEDDQNRGEMNHALAEFREAARATAALLAAKPHDPNRIFDHAQSEFWYGSLSYYQGDKRGAATGFGQYRKLADRLIEIDPENPDWLKEAAFAEGNLCTMALVRPRHSSEALRACSAAFEHMQEAEVRAKDSRSYRAPLANRHAWLADAEFANGHRASAWSQRRREGILLDELLREDPRNLDYQDMKVGHELGVAKLEQAHGDGHAARARLTRALDQVKTMIARDPKNKMWTRHRDQLVEALDSIR